MWQATPGGGNGAKTLAKVLLGPSSVVGGGILPSAVVSWVKIRGFVVFIRLGCCINPTCLVPPQPQVLFPSTQRDVPATG